MQYYKFDVIVVGAGPAGVAAAGALAGTGISVALLEAGVYAGAENWSGCVYFAENLAEQDCFGREAVESAPFERRVSRRGTLVHNGLDVVGLELTNQQTFRNCYTVLRPVYDLFFSTLARRKGAVHITETTVISLIRKESRVIGVQTNGGPLYADIVFIAEGDASHLVRSERLERVPEPHYFQGVKAVLSLSSEDIEKRFNLKAGEGCAYELLIRNALIAGRTAALNVGGFLYTNRDSLSLGYVVPLDNLKKHYRGDHDRLYEWMRDLPFIKELTANAKLSAYGAKLIRSGGWSERPILIEDGLAVGGASVGLGTDLPFPNFTGPASATGLFFARAVKTILGRGLTPDKKNLTKEYLAPLQASIYGRNAMYLSSWPKYFGKSSVLFGRTVDIICGTAHFLSSGSYTQTARFLRSHILSFRGLKEMISEILQIISTLKLWKPVIISLSNPTTVGHWIANLFGKATDPDPKLGFLVCINERHVNPSMFPWPVGSFIRRLSPALQRALELIYDNNVETMERKFARALCIVLRGMKLSDFLVLPLFGSALFLIALGTALWDAFRFYALRTPLEKFLADPVMVYGDLQRKARDLDAIKPAGNLESKLSTNTYRVGSLSHIRTFWPDAPASHQDMSKTTLWWVCPARVYVYEAPLAGRGRITVNFENCIKCESCWRAEPNRTLWGRHTDHKLIYRPESGAIPLLLDVLSWSLPEATLSGNGHQSLRTTDGELWYLSDGIRIAFRSTLASASALKDAIAKLPSSTDNGRKAWCLALGRRLIEKLQKLEMALSNDGRDDISNLVRSEASAIEVRLAEGSLFQALYCCRRMEQRLMALMGRQSSELTSSAGVLQTSSDGNLSYEEVSLLFPDRIVKQWEEEPLTELWTGALHKFIADHRDTQREMVRAISSVSPALGLIASRHFSAIAVLKQGDNSLDSGICAVAADHLIFEESVDKIHILGTLHLVPLAACSTLLLIAGGKGHLVPISTAGVMITNAAAIGFRAAGLSDVALDCSINKYSIAVQEIKAVPDALFYLAIALGAADYLSRRVKEHATSRIQFPGQMLDTEGRDGIAKLGAVKFMISRIESWRLLLETLYDSYPELGTPNSDFDLLCSTLAAMAFSPEPGSIGYDAGQVFGGFAYSEDDLLSRFYRDSALFRFLPPGHGSAASLDAVLRSHGMLKASPIPDPSKIILGEPLHKLVNQLHELSTYCDGLPDSANPTLAGQAKALAVGIRLLLVNVERKLESGTSREAEAAAVEVLLGLADTMVMEARLSAGRGNVTPGALFPVVPQGVSVVLDIDYETFCAAPGASHASGSFLVNVFDRSPRFVPEIQLHDPRLRARWTEVSDWFRKNCRDTMFDGLTIERAIEKNHRLPDEVIATVKRNKWLATYIPKSEDGLGWRKAEYYILNFAAGNFGDAGINLLIMANTSIGTTPILLGLEDELPRVREELAPLAHDSHQMGDIGTRLARIINSFTSPNPARIKKEYETVMKLVDHRIRHTRVIKYLSANFLRAFYSAGKAGRSGDFNGFINSLKRAAELFSHIMTDVGAALDEIPRRERCHRLFLRYLGHGGVSAFALTEPTAGSDSGGVRTTAKLTSAKLSPLADGRYAFRVNEQDEKSVRYLIDADRLLFTDQGIAYRTPDDQPSPILYENYDYTTDQGVRCYRYNGILCEFHDIGQPRRAETGLVYEYYGLSGAKMWITNGSIATQFCLYAQTTEGVTGFLVDRHSEGLKVGADEKKMGQRGSPTNEISIDNVRVPREAVIGYEGHGQVNALETLNVGRCGLAVVSGALMHKLLDESRKQVVPSPERDMLLGEAAAVLFGSESLAYYLIGLFDRPHESVRMESAIAKYACSEDIHELLSLVEQSYGPVGQTEQFLIEKARRDARILTIYEGTNEVQRFLILRDLIARAQTWPELSAPEGDTYAQTLAVWKNTLRRHVKEASALLGDTTWSDAMLQPALFPLAEIAGEILRLECIFYRMEWLDQQRTLLAQSDQSYVPALLAAGSRAAERTRERLTAINKRFERLWEQVKENIDIAEVRAADSTLNGALTYDTSLAPRTPLQAPLRILCIVRPVADLSPTPRLEDGSIAEIVEIIDPYDFSGVFQSLRLKDAKNANVSVDVLLIGRPRHEHLLRSAAGAADLLVRLNSDRPNPADIANAVRTLEIPKQYDFITIGAVCLNGDQGMGAYLAGLLSRKLYRKTDINVRQDGRGLEHVAPLAILSMTEAAGWPSQDISTAIKATFVQVAVLNLSDGHIPTAAARFEKPSVSVSATKIITTVAASADYLNKFAVQARSAQLKDYDGEIGRGSLADDTAVWAILDPRDQKANIAVLRSGRQAASIFNRRLNAVIPAPRKFWPALLGFAHAHGASRAFCLDTGDGILSPDGKREMVRLITRASSDQLIAAGPYWMDAFGLVAGEISAAGRHVPLFGSVNAIIQYDSKSALLSSPAYDGRLIKMERLEDGPGFLTTSHYAEIDAAVKQSNFIAIALDYPLDANWLMPLSPDVQPSLSEADVIIDLGYGIKDRSGWDLALELKNKLEAMGLAPMFGATRKVTQDLKLLPIEAQIGQTGIRVNPKLILALGISGAPQHIDYIGTRAEILCFNKDPDAPLMKLNENRPSPRIHPIVGDIFVTIRELIKQLG